MTSVDTVLARLLERDLLELATQIAREHNCTPGEMLGPSHLPDFVAARYAFYATLHARGHWSPGRIAQLVGRDRRGMARVLRAIARCAA